ncbi:hypothetical protein OAK19_00265 [Aureispira]|nr:hypothetical protein [Aureispira sp.]
MSNQIHTPPVVGEYGYYRSKSESNYWLVITEDGKEVGCHYSTKNKLPFKPFVACHGIIKRVTKEIKKYNLY